MIDEIIKSQELGVYRKYNPLYKLFVEDNTKSYYLAGSTSLENIQWMQQALMDLKTIGLLSAQKIRVEVEGTMK